MINTGIKLSLKPSLPGRVSETTFARWTLLF